MSDPANIPPRNGKNEAADGAFSSESEGTETSLIDVVLIVTRNLGLITRTTIVVGSLGLLFALFASSDYKSSARVIREVETDNPMRNLSGLSLLSGIGLNLGGSSTGLTPEAYPDILNSREVRLAVVRDTFYFESMGRHATFTEFANQQTVFTTIKRFTIGLPRTIRRALQDNPRDAIPTTTTEAAQLPTEEEEKAMKSVMDLVSSSVDPETGLMVISSTTKESLLASELTQSFVRHLVKRVETIRTEKTRRDLEFITRRYSVAADSLRAAENALAIFDDRNNNPQSARLRAERSRFQRQVTFKTELFSDLQAQLTQAEIDLQRSRPVITILEHPVPPIEPSGPRRFLLIGISLILGAILGVCLAFTRAVLDSIRSRDEGKAKIDEIKAALSESSTMKRVRRTFSRTKKLEL